MNTAVAKQEEKSPKVTYNVAGQDITLTYKIIRDYLTKGNGQVSDQDLMQFLSSGQVCRRLVTRISSVSTT